MRRPLIKSVLVTVKIAPEELTLWRARARKHTRGNVSAWLREAASTYSPGPRKRPAKKAA